MTSNKYDEMGITHSAMSNRERYEAVKAYWGEHRKIYEEQRKTRTYNSRRADIAPTRRAHGKCDCDGAGWVVQNDQLVKCQCGVAGASPTQKRLNTELTILSNKTFDNFHINRTYTPLPQYSVETQKKMLTISLDRCIKFAENPTGALYIWGSPGTGKSHLAAAVANHVSAAGWNVVYRSMPAVLDTIRDGMHGGNVDKILNDFATADLLVLDDIGADGAPTEWAEGRIFRLINDRVDKPTIYTSNFDVKDLPYQERIRDRLNAARRCWICTSSMRRPV